MSGPLIGAAMSISMFVRTSRQHEAAYNAIVVREGNVVARAANGKAKGCDSVRPKSRDGLCRRCCRRQCGQSKPQRVDHLEDGPELGVTGST